jgi:predicted transcriptional regulator YheO
MDNLALLPSEEEINEIKKTTLTAEDKTILNALEPVADAVANLFGSNCEVLIHSLEDLSTSVVKICNGEVTGRSVGSPLTALGIELLKNATNLESDVVSNYVTRHTDGKMIKSATALIRNGTKPIGMFCINYNLSAPLLDVIQNISFVEADNQENSKSEHFVMNAVDLIRHSLNNAINQISPKRSLSPQEKNKQIVSELLNQGIFDVKGAVDIVANELGVSRYTIYNYIREVRV